MPTAPTEDWIQESLARLESLEEERNRHEAALETSTDPAALRMNAQAVERLDAKIRSLYAELEAAAEQSDGGGDADADAELEADEDDDGEGDDEVSGGTTRLFKRADIAAQAAAMQGSPDTVKQGTKAMPAKVTPVAAAAVAAATPSAMPVSAVPVSTPSPFGGAPASAPFGGTPAATPFAGGGAPASPFGNSASPFGEVPQSAPFGSSGSDNSDSPGFSAPMSSTSFDAGNSFDDESSSGSGSKMGLIIGAAVVVLGLVGYLALGGKEEAPPPAAPTGPVKVIGGMEVPPDTQGPKTVQGSSDAIKGTQFKEGRPQPSGGGGGGSNTPRPADKPAKKDPRAKIENADDPLAGIDK